MSVVVPGSLPPSDVPPEPPEFDRPSRAESEVGRTARAKPIQAASSKRPQRDAVRSRPGSDAVPIEWFAAGYRRNPMLEGDVRVTLNGHPTRIAREWLEWVQAPERDILEIARRLAPLRTHLSEHLRRHPIGVVLRDVRNVPEVHVIEQVWLFRLATALELAALPVRVIDDDAEEVRRIALFDVLLDPVTRARASAPRRLIHIIVAAEEAGQPLIRSTVRGAPSPVFPITVKALCAAVGIDEKTYRNVRAEITRVGSHGAPIADRAGRRERDRVAGCRHASQGIVKASTDAPVPVDVERVSVMNRDVTEGAEVPSSAPNPHAADADGEPASETATSPTLPNAGARTVAKRRLVDHHERNRQINLWADGPDGSGVSGTACSSTA